MVPGIKLVAKYKNNDFTCDVVELVPEGEEEAAVFFQVNGENYTSVSSAGSAVMDGAACNGWRFWTIDGDQKPPKEKATPKEKKARAKKDKAETPPEVRARRPRAGRKIKKSKIFEQMEDGGWFCQGCMSAFEWEGEEDYPTECPEGHTQAWADEALGIKNGETVDEQVPEGGYVEDEGVERDEETEEAEDAEEVEV